MVLEVDEATFPEGGHNFIRRALSFSRTIFTSKLGEVDYRYPERGVWSNGGKTTTGKSPSQRPGGQFQHRGRMKSNVRLPITATLFPRVLHIILRKTTSKSG
jgi:hypothetical protein